MRALIPTLLGVALVLPTTALGQGDKGAEAAIHAGAPAWSAAWNAGDAKALAAFYTEDATVMAPGGEPAQGRAAIEAAFKEALKAAAGSKMTLTPGEVMTADGWAVEVGKYVQNGADGSHQDHGRYIAVWKNVAGKWMLHRDIWNSSM